MSALKSACYAAVDAFTDMPGSDGKRRDALLELVATTLAFIIAITIMAFVGKWLWNNIIVDLFSFAKPARTIWQILGLMIFWTLVK
jgi:hypothetical protein